MENLENKANFLRTEYAKVLTTLDADAPRKWGKMNVQQMIEHMSDYVRIASGRTPVEIVTEEERIPRMQGFLGSEKQFPENTPNVLMPDTPVPIRHATKQQAINELQEELDHFFEVHKTDPERKTNNPFFGILGYEQQVQLLHKHATHHLRQFGAVE
ncbi:MAG: hypothetical protein JWQ38_748 [Flavipsychrobacter sp.]|nr:hypothetical protein [Flavipsychrobacter sp.]